jgi:uncharacterized protein YkwD
MRLKLIIVLLAIAAGLTLVSYFFQPGHEALTKFLSSLSSSSTAPRLAEESPALNPPPLKKTGGEITDNRSVLTAEGIIVFTNNERKKNNLAPLEVNEILMRTADQKAKDILNRQYFAHLSPSGEGVKELAQTAGYESIIIGENLALGTFKDEAEVVEAWMESPGHRANILNPYYREIGVAVEKGLFEGKNVWVAVQHFAVPLSVCPPPEKILKEEIDNLKNQLTQLKEAIDLKRSRLEGGGLNRADYQNQLREYNNLVTGYNELVKKIQEAAARYNAEVNAYNRCLNQFAP